MSCWLKQSTAVEIKLGPFVDSGDGVTAETGLTITQSEALLAKNDGNWTQKNESTSLVHESNGWYRCLLDTTDTNTLGILMIQIAESGALPVWREFMVVAANVYDSLVGGGDVLDVSTTQFNGSAVTQTGGRPEVNTTHAAGTAWASGAITAAAIATGAIDADAIAADAISAAKIADGAIDAATFAAGAINAAAIATDAGVEIATAVWGEQTLDHIGIGTMGRIQTTSAGDASDAATFALDVKVALGTPAGVSIAADIAAIEAQTDDIGAAGAGLTALASAANLATLAAYVDTEVAAIKAKTDALPSDPADASDIAASFTTVIGKIDTIDDLLDSEIPALTTAVADLPTNAELSSALAPLATAANLATVASYLDTEIDAILADTNELQTDWANGGRLDTLLDGRSSQTSVDDLPTNAELATALAAADDAVLAAISAISTAPTANQNADALLDRTDAIEAGYTLRKALRIIAAACAGKSSGGSTAPVYRALDDSKDRITATANATTGDRTIVTLDPN